MGKLRRILAVLLVVVLFGAGLYSGFKLSGWRGFGSAPRTYSTPVLLQQIQTLSELVTVKYVLEKVEGIEVPSSNMIGQALGSENRLLLLAHGIVKAGIDLKRMKPEDLRVTGKHIEVHLPPPQVFDTYLDESQTKVIDRKSGLLAPPDRDLEQTVRQNAVDDLRRAARVGGILKDAQERAQSQLANLFLGLGFEKVDFVPAGATVPERLNLTPVESGGGTKP
jgi:hypothetical protein